MSRSRTSSSIVVILVALFALLLEKRPWRGWPPGSAPAATPSRTTPVPSPAPAPSPGATRAEAPQQPGRAVPSIEDRGEAREVGRLLDRIDDGGPFLHRKDGAVFRNAEGRLPRKANGYYREYTVETPGSPDRGARRVIRGEGGELYYTNDHYRTFQRIDSGAN